MDMLIDIEDGDVSVHASLPSDEKWVAEHMKLKEQATQQVFLGLGDVRFLQRLHFDVFLAEAIRLCASSNEGQVWRSKCEFQRHHWLEARRHSMHLEPELQQLRRPQG